MVKSILNSSGLFLFISVLFAIGAVGKTVSSDPLVVNLQWMCAIVFALIGLWRAKRKRGGGTPIKPEANEPPQDDPLS